MTSSNPTLPPPPAPLQQQQQQQQYYQHYQQQQQQQLYRASSLDAAISMVSMQSPPLVNYSMQDTMLRLSVKLFNCTPDLLVPQVKNELLSLLRVAETSLLEGYVRPGCVHLTVAARAPVDDVVAAAGGCRAQGLAVAVEEVLARGLLPAHVTESMHVQMHDDLVVVKRRKIMAAIDMAKSSGILPRIFALRPVAVGIAPEQYRTKVLIVGTRLHEDDTLIMCRQGGRNLTVELPEDEEAEVEMEGESEAASVTVGVLGLAPGCAEFEIQAGSFLGHSAPLLVLPNEAAAAEIRQLEDAETAAGIGLPVAAFLRDIGLVTQYLERECAKEEGLPVPNYTPDLVQRIQDVACRLVAASIARGWSSLAAYLFPAVTAAGQSAAEACAFMDSLCPSGASLLHVAVGTGRVDVIDVLASWVSSLPPPTPDRSSLWPVDAKGNGGVTPLHVAAVLPVEKSMDMRRALAGISSSAYKLWSIAQTDDGTTPEGLAEMVAKNGRSDSNASATTSAGGGGGGGGATSASAAAAVATAVGECSGKKDAWALGDADCALLKATRALADDDDDDGDEEEEGEGEVEGRLRGRRCRAYGGLALTRLGSWKSRNDAKSQLLDSHIETMFEEVEELDEGEKRAVVRGSPVAGGVTILRTAIAAALGAIVVSMRPTST